MEERRPTAEWNEFDWERALRESDNYAARYFRLLQRFCDLPGADDLITRQLAREFNADQALPDCDGDCASCDLRWNCEFALHTEWDMGRGYGGMDEEMAAGEMADDEAGESDVEALEAGTKGDPLFFETSPTFHLLRQTALGWCNVYSVILPGEAAETGLRILYHIGRALANLRRSLRAAEGEHRLWQTLPRGAEHEPRTDPEPDRGATAARTSAPGDPAAPSAHTAGGHRPRRRVSWTHDECGLMEPEESVTGWVARGRTVRGALS
jgi:hypothetical protein